MPHGSVLPHADCYKFYYCYNGVTSILQCPVYYKFISASGKCEYSPDCVQDTDPAVPPISSYNPCTTATNGSNQPHESSCKYYYYCTKGIGILQSCPDGWGFKKDEQLCVKEYNCP